MGNRARRAVGIEEATYGRQKYTILMHCTFSLYSVIVVNAYCKVLAVHVDRRTNFKV